MSIPDGSRTSGGEVVISLRTWGATSAAHADLSRALEDTASAQRRLSRGERVTRAADDAAGLAVSERMRAEITGRNQAMRNIADGLSVVDTIDGVMSAYGDIVVRGRELLVQIGAPALQRGDMEAIATEAARLQEALHAWAVKTKFNGHNVLLENGSISIQTGINGGETLSIKTVNATGGNLQGQTLDPANDVVTMVMELGNYAPGGNKHALAVASGDYARHVREAQDLNGGWIAVEEFGLDTYYAHRAEIGALRNRLAAELAVQQRTVADLSAAESRVRDADVAAETAAIARASVRSQAAVAVLAQASQSKQQVPRLLSG